MIQEPFFWLYLASAVAVYWLLTASLRLSFLALASVVYIGCYDLVSLGFLNAMSVGLYLSLPLLARRDKIGRTCLFAAVFLLTVPIIVFKLTSSIADQPSEASSWIVPLGMSYYVFRLVHVAIDTYRTARLPKSAEDFFSYAFMFTIFTAGPIQRYEPFQADREHKVSGGALAEGSLRIAVGLIKQGVVYYALIDLRSRICGESSFDVLDGHILLLVLVVTYLGSYVNLSAYTDIAVGASRLFGFRVMENFNFPVFATSIDEFWRRWHISLSSWCQAYVYAPVLGTFRNPYIAIIASFQVMGLWHAITLNRVAWGLFQAAGLIAVIELRRRSGWRQKQGGMSGLRVATGWVFTQLFITLSFIFVLNESSNDVLLSLRALARLFVWN